MRISKNIYVATKNGKIQFILLIIRCIELKLGGKMGYNNKMSHIGLMDKIEAEIFCIP